jgi:hypothetical protein
MNNQTIENLFIEMPPEQAEVLSGGRKRRSRGCSFGSDTAIGATDSILGGGSSRFFFDLQTYIFGIGAAFLFGNPGVTPEEMQYVWKRSLRFW